MKIMYSIGVLALFSFCCHGQGELSNPTAVLKNIIATYQDHEGYDKNQYPLGLYTKEYYSKEADFARSLRKALADVSIEKLSENDMISYELLDFELRDQIDFYEFERYLNPLLSDSGFHSSLTYHVRPLLTYDQVKKYLNKLNALPEFVDQHFVNLREGLKKGVSQPKVIFEGYESTYNDHIVADFQDSYYYSPFKNLPNGLTKAQQDSVLK
ncbi:MAG: DUF885 family protein, partial [Flavobacteriaceae bacterium]